MSAFMVSKGHIDRLVALAIYGPSDGGVWWGKDDNVADTLGAMLTAENLRSIHARYPDTINDPDAVPGSGDWETPYVFPVTTERISAIEGLNALACYEYQACETDDWLTTEAHEFCEGLRDRLCSVLSSRATRGWDDWDRHPVPLDRFAEAR